jgi:hypothetical protein
MSPSRGYAEHGAGFQAALAKYLPKLIHEDTCDTGHPHLLAPSPFARGAFGAAALNLFVPQSVPHHLFSDSLAATRKHESPANAGLS